MACEDIGRFNGPRSDFAEFVVGEDPTGACQRVRIGHTSPGPVDDGEILSRFVFAPAHLKVTGEVDETLVLDAFKIGASITRVQSEWADALLQIHEYGEVQAASLREGTVDREAQPDRIYIGVVRFRAVEARSLAIDGVQERIRVYDTSLPNNPNHGDVVANGAGLSKVLRKELRVRLFMAMQKAGLFLSPFCGEGLSETSLGMQVHKL